ncbi:MAG: hypothetical protein K6U14_11085 [Firmicutes bacterium]|nr:hypothetical protein [Alicyclobacillaceae bacterium]MCL6498156.1 hypothetical protein [Bacillota bacterium]
MVKRWERVWRRGIVWLMALECMAGGIDLVLRAEFQGAGLFALGAAAVAWMASTPVSDAG